MKPEDLLNAIGEIDEEMIRDARKYRKINKHPVIAITTAAACITLACIGITALQRFNADKNMISTAQYSTESASAKGAVLDNNYISSFSSGTAVPTESLETRADASLENSEGTGLTEDTSEDRETGCESLSNYSGNSEVKIHGTGNSSVAPLPSEMSVNTQSSVSGNDPSMSESSYVCEESEMEKDLINIYYIADQEICSKSVMLPYNNKNIFEEWKKQNKIGSEVKFIDAVINKYDFDNGEYYTYCLYITHSLDEYCIDNDKALLMQSLEQTMTNVCFTEISDFEVVVIDGAEDDISLYRGGGQ